jgi:hypothetical protein
LAYTKPSQELVSSLPLARLSIMEVLLRSS